MRNRICLAAAVLCVLAGEPAAAQVRSGSVLDRRVTVTFNQAPLESVLRTLKRQYGIRISYSNTALNLRQPVTLSAQNQPLRQVLSDVLEGKNIGYELVGDQLVLHPAPPKTTAAKPAAGPASTASASTTTTVSRAVIDKAPDAAPAAPTSAAPRPAATTEPAPRPASSAEAVKASSEKAPAPVRTKTNKAPAQKTTSKPSSGTPATAKVKVSTAAGGKAAKARSTTADKTRKMSKPAAQVPATTPTKPTTTTGKTAVKAPNNPSAVDAGTTASTAPPTAAASTAPATGTASDSAATAAAAPPPAAPADSTAKPTPEEVPPQEPARPTYTRKAQVSLLGPLGSNGLRAGQTVNQVSINLLGGYAAGVEGFEAAGLFNVDRDTVAGVQLAGWANLVGRHLDGVQAAGLANVLGGDGQGWQAAGLLNVAARPVAGAQTAGLFNFVGPRKRAEVVTASVDAASGAKTTSYQALPREYESRPAVQAAGLFNVSLANQRGGQIAGLFNVSNETRGVQVAGLFNAAKTVHGVQLAGLVNFADSVQGVSIAPFNFVLHGYHRLELTYSESWPVTATLKLGGSAAFYTFLTAAYSGFGSGPRRWATGYGVGTDMWARRRVSLSLDLTAMQVNEEQRGVTDQLNLHNQLRLLVGLTPFRPGSHFRLVAGPTVNVLVTSRYDSTRGEAYSNLREGRKLWLNSGSAATKVFGWYGYSVGLRF